MSIIQSISGSVQEGKAKSVKQLVRQALEEGYDPKVILNEGLLTGMMVVADKFKKDEVFVPEVLVSSRAINAGLTILEGYLTTGDGDGYIGRVVLGTVRGDWHDIGKHMVSLSLRQQASRWWISDTMRIQPCSLIPLRRLGQISSACQRF